MASWIFIVTALSCFSFSVVAGATTFGKPDYEGAAEQLPAGRQLVLFRSADGGDNVAEWFRKAYKHEVLCTVDAEQVARLAARYDVGQVTIKVKQTPVDVATVSGGDASVADIKATLGDPSMSCTVVEKQSVFFLPFDVHVS